MRPVARSSSRRRFLRLSAGLPVGVAGWLSSRCGAGPESPAAPTPTGSPRPPTASAGEPIAAPKVNGGVNVQPLRCFGCAATDETIEPELVALQLSAAYGLGFDGIRITAPLGDRNTFLAVIPYVRAARALGIDALVLLADFTGLTLARALHDDRRRAEVLAMYAEIFAPAPLPVRPGLGGLGPGGTGRIARRVRPGDPGPVPRTTCARSPPTSSWWRRRRPGTRRARRACARCSRPASRGRATASRTTSTAATSSRCCRTT